MNAGLADAVQRLANARIALIAAALAQPRNDAANGRKRRRTPLPEPVSSRVRPESGRLANTLCGYLERTRHAGRGLPSRIQCHGEEDFVPI